MYNAAVVLISIILAGCATAPGYRPPEVTLPAAFRETPDSGPRPGASGPGVSGAGVSAPVSDSTVATNAFWGELGDTTLTRLMNETVRANLDIQAAEARVRGARSSRTVVALDLAPTVTFGGGYTRQRLSSAAFPIGSGGGFPDQDVWDGGFDASWELDLFGRVRRNVQAQGALVGVSREDLRDIQVSLTAELARAYFDLRGAQEQLSVAQRNSENQQRTLSVTRQRLDAGRGTAFDTERAQAQLSFTLASIPVLQSRVAQAQYQIGVLVGRSPTSVAGELGVAALPPLPEVGSLATPETVIRIRPDVAAAERRLAVERALVGAARAEYLPRLSLAGSAGYSSTTFNSLGDRGTFRYAVGPIISWPALNLGRVKARVDVSRAREEEARAQYDQTVLLALQDVETSLSRYQTSRSRVDRIQDAARASERAAELARVRFSGGVADFLQVLDAERTQLEAQDLLAQGRTEAATAYAALYKALGGTSLAVD